MNCRIRATFVAGLLLLLYLAAPAESGDSPWFARSWQSDKGLPDNTVVGIEQTPDGFLWVATQAGLVRFDGLKFREFTQVAVYGAPTSLLQALFIDHAGRLWIAKDRRIVVCVDKGETKVVESGSDLPNVEARLIMEDGEGAVWISYIGGDLVRIKDQRVRSFGSRDGLPGGSTCQLATDGEGQLWFAAGEWVGVFRNDRFEQLIRLRGQRISGARPGGIWVCSGPQIFRCAKGILPVKIGELPLARPNANAAVVYEDRAGKLWIGTREAGLFCYDGSSFSTVVTSHHEILCLKEDREGNIWVGTRGGGLNQLRPRSLDLLSVDPRVPFEGVRSACQDTKGNVWAVSQSGAVWRKWGKGWVAVGEGEGWRGQYAQCIAADPGGGVWIGTQYTGLFRWQDGVTTASLCKTNGLSGDLVTALLTTGSGAVWVGTASVDAQHHALQRWESGRVQTFDLPSGSGWVVAMVFDSAGDGWAATSAGLLLRIHQDVLLDETRKTLAAPHGIRTLYAGADGSVWIGYAGMGLGRLKAGGFTHFRAEQGLYDDYISQIVSDGRGRMWFAGNRGIFHVHEQEFDDLAQGQTTRVHSVAYGRNEGLSSLQASYGFWPSTLFGADGRLYFPMQSGLAVVYAPDLKENGLAPPVVIERVTSGGKTVAAYEAGELAGSGGSAAPLELHQENGHLRLPPGQRQVEFAFTALGLVMPENLGLKYRLQGVDADWVTVGERRMAYYPQIPPGGYRFQVVACNNDGIWNETGAALAITVEPYLWQTAWFRVVTPVSGFTLAAGAIFVSMRRRHRRQIERLELQQATERERTRIAQDLHDDLGAALTQISLNTAMVQNPAVTPEVASGLLQEIDQRARELVTALDEIVWAANPRNDKVSSLSRYLCQYAQRSLFATEIACRLEVAPGLPDAPVGAEQRHNLFLAFKEALNNAVRHSGAKELTVKVEAHGQTLSVTLADNGRGFVPGPAAEGADGMGNMRARLDRLGGMCQVISAPGKGTQVILSCPLQGQPI